MDKESARQRAKELENAVNKAYDELSAGIITQAEFDQVAENAEKENERVAVMFKSKQRANQFHTEEDGEPPEQETVLPGLKQYRDEYEKMFRAAQPSSRSKAVGTFHFGLKYGDDHGLGLKTQGVANLSGEATSGTSSPSALQAGAYFLTGTVGPAVMPEFVPGIVELRMFPTVIEDLFPTRPVSSPVITYLKETAWNNAAAAVPEGATKPTSTHGLTRYSTQIGKVAALERITDEAIQDAAYIWALFQQRLVQGVQRQTEAELLAGAGYPGIDGLFNHSSAFTQSDSATTLSSIAFPAPGTGGAFMNANTITSLTAGRSIVAASGSSDTPTGNDLGVAMLNMATDIRINTLYEPDAIVMNPLDYQTLRLATDKNGQFFGGSFWGRDYGYPNNAGQLSAGAVDSFTVWGLKLQTTPVLPAGLILVGDFQDAGFVARLGGLRVDVTNVNGTDFEQNLWTARAEHRVGLVVERDNLFELAVITTGGVMSS